MMKNTSLGMILGMAILISAPAFAEDDLAAGFKWASEKGVKHKTDCHDEAGEFLRDSEEFTEGCLDFLNEASGAESADKETTDEPTYEDEEVALSDEASASD